MKPILDTATMRWKVNGIAGTFAHKNDAIAAIEAKKEKHLINVRVTTEMHNALVKTAEKRGTTITEVVREAIRKEVEL